jgi:hypothetical protein
MMVAPRKIYSFHQPIALCNAYKLRKELQNMLLSKTKELIIMSTHKSETRMKTTLEKSGFIQFSYENLNIIKKNLN